MKRVALVYDRVNKWGGAERVLLALHELFPEAPLYTAVYSERRASWAGVFPRVIPSFLNKLPLAKDNHEFLAGLTPAAFESFDFSQYDLVVSVSSESAKGVITGPDTLHVNYCLTPTRYLWSGYLEYFPTSVGRVVSGPVVRYLRKWDLVASWRADIMIAVSSEVKRRIGEYYGRDSEVIHPPVGVEGWGMRRQGGEYYLVVSRLVKYKRVELAVGAFNLLNRHLVLVGSGSEETKLKRAASGNTKFAGFVGEGKLRAYYSGARAVIMPQLEDFGIVAVEAQAMGVPVIAYGKGGALDTVVDGKTGILFNEQTVESLLEAIERFETTKFVKKDIMKNAQKFSKEKFAEKFRKVVNKSL